MIVPLSSILSKVSLQLHKPLKTVLKMGTGTVKHNRIEPNEYMFSCQYDGGFYMPDNKTYKRLDSGFVNKGFQSWMCYAAKCIQFELVQMP